ncbi:DUF2637 domain-containing protein [Streptomyces sp. AM 2-1-1]|uniref:DUF2637 domain-containing protein n=1 Tax=Streptomyces sp. AM 2-1-1 TaxID=3028709 RepID=UPI0023B9DFA1|nr:DUF2637 domain-containing protein [Streptomyces sp. AM 2-1-1]WEH43978.1 DUF2637 domain-containing protein [Streptomyces sp. AM 2-1-1]
MTMTEWPQTAATDTPVSLPRPTVSETPGIVSPTADIVSGTPKRKTIKPSITGTQKRVIGVIVIAAITLAGIGLYLSFEHVASFAHDDLRFGSLTEGRLFAVGVDVGIMVMIAVDLLMAWLKRPIGWIRYPVWFLTGATVVLNAASGAPKDQAWKFMDYIAAGAHGVVPILFITVVELGRTAIDRAMRPDHAERDSIPLIRWVLAPFATPRIYRRMRLWGVTSYPEMIRRDQDLIAYEQWLKRKHKGDLGKASEDELLPMKMAPYGYTVAEALAMPDAQDQAAEQRKEEAASRRRNAETRRKVADADAKSTELLAEGKVEETRAAVAGKTGQAKAQADAKVSAAEKVAALETAALETAAIAEARARTKEADRQTAESQEKAAEADLRRAGIERQAAKAREEAAEHDRIATAEKEAIETQTIAEARLAAAKADNEAAEIKRQAAKARAEAAEYDRIADAEAQAIETQTIAEARLAAAKADAEAAGIEALAARKRRDMEEADKVAAAETRAVETQAIAEAARATAEAEKATDEAKADAAEARRATAEAERLKAQEIKAREALLADAERAKVAAAEARLAAAEIDRRAIEIEDEAKLKPRERAVRKVARLAFAADLAPDGLGLEDITRELCARVTIADVQHAVDVSSTDTASKYRAEAAALVADGYRP